MSTNHVPYKRYDDEFMRSAIDLLVSSGRSISEIAGDLGIPCRASECRNHQLRGHNAKTQRRNDARHGRSSALRLRVLASLRWAFEGPLPAVAAQAMRGKWAGQSGHDGGGLRRDDVANEDGAR